MSRIHMSKRTPLMRQEILSLLCTNDEVLKRCSVKRIGLFGSFARGQQRQNSDVDLLVEFDEPTFDNFTMLSDYLEKLFRRRVEILTPEGVESIRVKRVADSIKKSVIYV